MDLSPWFDRTPTRIQDMTFKMIKTLNFGL